MIILFPVIFVRFVRFVSSPEVLERVVTIEREIEQIEDSVNSYDASNAAETDGNLGDRYCLTVFFNFCYLITVFNHTVLACLVSECYIR